MGGERPTGIRKPRSSGDKPPPESGGGREFPFKGEFAVINVQPRKVGEKIDDGSSRSVRPSPTFRVV